VALLIHQPAGYWLAQISYDTDIKSNIGRRLVERQAYHGHSTFLPAAMQFRLLTLDSLNARFDLVISHLTYSLRKSSRCHGDGMLLLLAMQHSERL